MPRPKSHDKHVSKNMSNMLQHVIMSCHVVTLETDPCVCPCQYSTTHVKNQNPPIPHITCNGPSPLINIYLLPTTPEPGSPSVGTVLWCQDDSGFFLAIRPNLGKMQNVKCPGTHCASCVLKCCPTMCQWNLFLNPGVDIEQIGGLFNWQGGVGG